MKNLLLFEEFGNEFVKELTYYSFDVDDNLLYMPTRIHMEHLVDGEWIEEPVDTDKFVTVRNDSKNWRYLTTHDGDGSFVEFRDWGPNGAVTFLKDFKYAVINKLYAPSWTKFIECLINGNIFSIITSRGHAPSNVRLAIRWLIYEYGLDKFKNLPLKGVDPNESFDEQMLFNLVKFQELFDYKDKDAEHPIDAYLDLCPIYTISSPFFKSKYGNYPPEEAKRLSLRDFNEKVRMYADYLGVRAKYGFSDDDPRFVKAAADEFLELKQKHKNLDYSVFDTGSDRKIKKVL